MSSPCLPGRRVALLQLSALASLSVLHAGCAAAPQRALLDLQLIDRDSGAAISQYTSRGQRFSPGLPGARYAIRLSNNSRERVLVVLSVDGVNAITGDTAAWTQSGYVLSPGESCDITGWRKSDERIAAFEFTSLGDSYAARTGRPANVGVIGAAVFRETPPVVYGNQVVPPVAAMPAAPGPLSRLNGATADAAQAVREGAGLAEAERSARARLGTGHGASEWSPIQRTVFQRRTSQPEQLLEVRYDSQANLMAAGIMPRALAALPGVPRAFPDSGEGYVPDPPARW